MLCCVLLTRLAEERMSLKIVDLEPDLYTGSMRPRPLGQPPGKLEAQAVAEGAGAGAGDVKTPAPLCLAQVTKRTMN